MSCRGTGGVAVFVLAVVVASMLGWGQGDCTRSYEGDLVLTGDQRLVITEGVLCVHGNIFLQDSARLELSDTVLRITGSRDPMSGVDVRIQLDSRACLSMRNVTIETPDNRIHQVAFWMFGENGVQIDRVIPSGGARVSIAAHDRSQVSVNDTALGHITVGDRSSVEIRDSSVEVVLLVFTEFSAAEVAGLREGLHDLWELQRGPGVSFSLRLADTTVGKETAPRGYEGWQVHVHDHAVVTVRDSEDIGIGIKLAQLPDVIDGMRPGYYAGWSLHDGRSRGAGNIHLVNTSISLWEINLPPRQRSITVRRSQVGNLWASEVSMNVRCENLVVGSLRLANSHLSFTSFGSTRLIGLVLSGVRLDLSGEVSLSETEAELFWSSSTGVREYEVRVQDRAGQPAREVQVRLEDPSGWITTHTTDQDGVLRFTIRFDDTNYDKTWHLVTPRGDGVVRVPVRFTTDTPLIVSAW